MGGARGIILRETRVQAPDGIVMEVVENFLEKRYRMFDFLFFSNFGFAFIFLAPRFRLVLIKN
jgi:hypothetical protein